MQQSQPKVIIIGAGIGGLAAAIALQRHAIPVQVFERAKALEVIGSGLSLWPNALRALELLGLQSALACVSRPMAAGAIYRWDGRVLLDPHATDARLMPIGIHRADLQALLLAALDQAQLQLGAECMRVEQSTSHVTAHFADGQAVQADALIAADGIHSHIRSQLYGQQALRYAGYTAWRGVAHFDHALLKTGETWGAGRRFGCIPLFDDRVYWFATANAPAGQRAAEGEKPGLLQDFGNWHAPIPALIEATPPEAILRTDIADRAPLMHWSKGRITLLGDAAHPMTPNLGQGACQALEDAVVLARCLAQHSDVVVALRQYESLRIARSSAIVRQSRQLGWVGQWQHPWAVRVRELLLRSTPPAVQLRQIERVVLAEL